jgi:hypothetical protein
MAKETVHGTNMIGDNNVADKYNAVDAYCDGGIDVSAGFNPKDKKGAQAITTSDVSGGDDGQFNVSSLKFDTGPVFDGVGDEPHERDALPRIEEEGSVPNPGDGFAGAPIDFNSVAPYKWPEFPADSYTAGAGSSPVPLT